MRMSYKYELIAFIDGMQVKRMFGNDINELQERFEMWFIKSKYDREDLDVCIHETHVNMKEDK